jgi:Transposase
MQIAKEMESYALTHLPIIKEYARRMGFVEIIDQALACGMHTNPGKIILGLVMNVLCGRSPVYRVEEFFRTRDVALLLGNNMAAESLNDDNIGRVLDRVYNYGTWKLFSEISIKALHSFNVDCSVVHQDTTSVSVWGEYKPAPGDPFLVTLGHSKDKRPDLKQFIISLLCVEGNLPCHAGIVDGNASDKKTNGKILAELPKIMNRYGVGEKEFIYVADSALATEDNFSIMKEDIFFITRFPETFNLCGQLISKTVASGVWQDVGRLSHRIVNNEDICASYRLHEEKANVHGREYRAVIVHSDAHDRRRQKRINKIIAKDKTAIETNVRELKKKMFFCLPDAQAAAKALQGGLFISFLVPLRKFQYTPKDDRAKTELNE